MNVLQHFSENQRDYLLYQQRLDAGRLEATWKIEQEEAKRREAQATQRAEAERQEKERLLQMLKQVGIDPHQSQL